MRSSIRLVVCAVIVVVGVSSLGAGDDSPNDQRRLDVQCSEEAIDLKSSGSSVDPAVVAVFRIHSPKITYSYMFDGLVPDELRDRMFFKGMHLFYPAQRVVRPVGDAILKRQSELPNLRLPKELPAEIRPLVPGHPPIHVTDGDREVARKVDEFYRAAIGMLSTPIVAVWGLRTTDGAPDERLVLYANGRANDAGGNLSWDWRDDRITVNFPNEQRQLVVAADGRTLTGRWIGDTEVQGKLLGFSKTGAMPVLATWHMKNVKGIVSAIKLYANGRVNDQHSKAAWSWSDAKLTVSADGNATAAEFTVEAAGRSMKGRWQQQSDILADMHNPVVAFVPAGPETLKPNDPKLWASLDRATTDYFRLLVSHVPNDRRPPQAVIEFFTEQSNDANFQIVPVSETDVEFRIVAATAEQAEARVRGLLAIYDHGVIRPIQQFLQHRLKLLQEELKTREADVARIKQELKDDLDQAERPPVFDEVIVTFLNDQQKRLSVKAASLKTEIEEAARSLKSNQHRDADSAELKTTKPEAEIELAGVAAKLKKVEEIQSHHTSRPRDQANRDATRSRLGRPEYLVRKSGNIIGAHGHVIRKYVPFQVVDQRIVIAPVERADKSNKQ